MTGAFDAGYIIGEIYLVFRAYSAYLDDKFTKKIKK